MLHEFSSTPTITVSALCLCCTLKLTFNVPMILGDNYLQQSTAGACSIRLQTGVVTQWRRYAVHTMTSYDTPDRFGQELVHVKLVKADPDSQLSLPSLGQHRPVLLQYCNRKQCHSQFIKPYLRQFCLFYSFLHDHQSLSFFVSR